MQLGLAHLTPAEQQQWLKNGLCIYCGNGGHFLPRSEALGTGSPPWIFPSTSEVTDEPTLHFFSHCHSQELSCCNPTTLSQSPCWWTVGQMEILLTLFLLGSTNSPYES